MNRPFIAILFSFFLLFSGSALQAQSSADNQSLDKIVAIVNDHIILKSDVDQRVSEYLYQMQQQGQQQIQFSKEIWYTILQDIVQNYVLLDKAQIDSVTITQEQVDQRINQRIGQLTQQLGGEAALEQRVGKSIIQLRADLREQYREDLTVQRYKAEKRRKINITRPEVEDFFENIPSDSLPTIPEEVALSQIVTIPEANKDARTEAKNLAAQLRDSLINHGKNIEELAKKYSEGPSASSGGKIPMYPLDQLAPEYSAAAAALKPGEISEVVETSFGFHVIRLNKRQGDQIDTNHILITLDQENFDDDTAIKQLTHLRDSIETNEDVSFSDVARTKSEDPNTAPQGGRVLNPQTGSRLIAIDQLDPALYRIVLLLEDEGEISEPKPFTVGTGNNTKKAFRIVRMDEHNPEHTANLEEDYSRIKSSALQDKQYKLVQKWIDQLKKEVYIEYKIPMPEQFVDQNMNLTQK